MSIHPIGRYLGSSARCFTCSVASFPGHAVWERGHAAWERGYSYLVLSVEYVKAFGVDTNVDGDVGLSAQFLQKRHSLVLQQTLTSTDRQVDRQTLTGLVILEALVRRVPLKKMQP